IGYKVDNLLRSDSAKQRIVLMDKEARDC
ncbi:hypothetical protein L195_g052393, partial [Trifolium pratense]